MRFPPSALNFNITNAAHLWVLGKNTAEIADLMRVHEAVVANRTYEIIRAAKAIRVSRGAA